MANMFIGNTYRFKPFSFQEMLQPVMIYKEAYDTQEAALAELDVLVGDVASKIANENPDSEISKTYKKYQEDLDKALTSFYDNGYSLQNKKDLAKLKARYTKEINPINEAYKRYTEYNNNISKLAFTNPELIIQGNYGISDFMGGNNPTPIVVNTEDLMNQAMATAKIQAGRTYRESDWTSTAGGRFLERTRESGLTDVEFNNALAQVKASSDGLTYKDSEGKTQQLSDNAKLLYASIADVTGGTDFRSLNDSNKTKALQAIIKGTRAGFQYDKKIETEDDPMFAHKLALERDELKRQQTLKDAADKAKKDKIADIGSSTYRAVNLGKQSVDKYLSKDEFGNVQISDRYQVFLNSKGSEGVIKDKKYLERVNKENAYNNPTRGMAPQFNFYTPEFNLKDYDDFVATIEQLGLDSETATRSQIIKRMQDAANKPDAFGRKRASIVTTDTELIQTYIEKGLNNDELQEIEGFEKDKDGILRYKNKQSVKLNDLLDDKGKLNILSIDMDYTTGERTFTAKDKKGNIREFRIPDDASFESDDQLALNINTAKLRELETKINSGDIIDDDKTLYKTPYGNITAKQYREMIQDELDLVFSSILNYMGKSNINN